MRSPDSPPTRPITRVDVAASAVAKLAPRRLRPHIDQARRDARAILDGLSGIRERSYRSDEYPARPPPALAQIDPIEHALPRTLREPYAGLKRDFKMVARGLRGEHPSPLIDRPKTLQRAPARSLSTATSSATHRMRIDAVIRETEDAVTLQLSQVGAGPTTFEPGQFLSVRAEVAGETLWRAYSICTAPASGLIAITIKRVPEGRVSNYLNDHAHVGQVLEVRGPSGRFTLPQSRDERHIVLLGGGSGITPLMSHARHWLAHAPESRVTLLYGNRRRQDIVFRDALSELAQKYPERFTLRHVLSEPSPDFSAGLGMLDEATTARELDALELLDDARTVYLICGPEPMMKAAHAALTARGVDEARIHEERFTAPTAEGGKSSYHEQLVAVRLNGKVAAVKVAAGQTILEAAAQQNVPLDFSCTMGGCGACMVQLVDGTVDMEEPNCLSKAERADGKILACVARPTSPCRVEKA